jgi:hypothetical protein
VSDRIRVWPRCGAGATPDWPVGEKPVLARRIGRRRFHNQQAVAVDDGLSKIDQLAPVLLRTSWGHAEQAERFFREAAPSVAVDPQVVAWAMLMFRQGASPGAASARASRKGPSQAKCSSRRRSRTLSRDRGSRSMTEAPSLLRGSRVSGGSTRLSTSPPEPSAAAL